MTEKEKILAGQLLEEAADRFSNYSCNDMPPSLYEGWTQEEKTAFIEKLHYYNGNGEDDEEERTEIESYPDWFVMGYLASKLMAGDKDV